MAEKKPYTTESVYAAIVYEGAKTPRQIQQDHAGNDDAGALNRILKELRAAGHVQMGGIDHLLTRGSVPLPTDPYTQPAKKAKPDPAAIGAQLKEMRAKVKAGPDHGVTAEKAAALLDGLTTAQLKEVAKVAGVTVDYRSKTKADLTRHIQRTTVGSALDHHAVVGYRDQGVAPAWVRDGQPPPDTGQQWSRPRDDVPPDHPDSRESVEREFADAQRREDEMREKYPRAEHKVFLRRDLETGDCKEAVAWQYGVGWSREVGTFPWTEKGLTEAGRWAVEHNAHDDNGHPITDRNALALHADAPKFDRPKDPRCRRCGVGAQLPGQIHCAVCEANDVHRAETQAILADYDANRRRLHEDGKVPEPPDQTALVDRGGDTWVRTDNMPGGRGTWHPLTDGPGWDERARDGLGTSRGWEDMAEHGPFKPASPETTARAVARVRRDWLLDHPEDAATPDLAPSSAAAGPASGGKLEFNYDRIVTLHQEVLADLGRQDDQALNLAEHMQHARVLLDGLDEARDATIAVCEALLDGMDDARLDATSLAGVTEAAESLNAAKVADLLGHAEETEAAALEVAKQSFLAGESVRHSVEHIRGTYGHIAAGVQDTGVRGEALEGAGA